MHTHSLLQNIFVEDKGREAHYVLGDFGGACSLCSDDNEPCMSADCATVVGTPVYAHPFLMVPDYRNNFFAEGVRGDCFGVGATIASLLVGAPLSVGSWIGDDRITSAPNGVRMHTRLHEYYMTHGRSVMGVVKRPDDLSESDTMAPPRVFLCCIWLGVVCCA